MRHLGAFALGTLVAAAPAVGVAQEEPPLTFRSAFDLAVASNLELAAARRGRAVRQAEVQAAGQHPNPSLVFESAKDVPHRSLLLEVPFEPWKRSARIDLAKEELTLADVDEAAALQALRRRVRMGFYGLLAAEEGASLGSAMHDVAARVHEVAQARFDEGAAPRLDVMAAELGLARATAELELARSERASAQAELNAVLNRPPDRPLAVVGDLAEAVVPPIEEATARATAGNPELRAAEREVAIEERRLGLLKAERVPTPVFTGGADFDAPGEFDVGYRAGLSLAVPIFSRNQGEIAGSIAKADQARTHRDALRRDVEARAFAAQARGVARRAQVAAYRDTLVPTATNIESLAEEAYRLGRGSVLAVLEAQRSLRDTRREYLDSLLSLQSALADLEDVLGGPMD
jgi:outer membrane protein, heavy metal efflux system